MSKSWIMWSLILILAGVFGLWMVYYSRQTERKEASVYRSQFSPENDEYLRLYNEWNSLGPQAKTQQPWGQGRYGGPEIRGKVKSEQPLRLQAYMAELAGGRMEPHILSDDLYGNDWREKVQQYRQQQELLDGVQIAAVASVFAGMLFLTGYIFVSVVLRLTAGIKKKGNPQQDQTSVPPKDRGLSENKPLFADNRFLAGNGRRTGQQRGSNQNLPVGPRQTQQAGQLCQQAEHPWEQQPNESGDSDGYFRKMEADVAGAGSEQRPVADTGNLKENLKSQAEVFATTRRCPGAGRDDADILTLMSTLPITENLSELTQEISAIREFAAQQQNRVRQLQDGYDWNIIKRFCLRVIRCIDNLDERIKQLSKEGQETGYLEDVRDELVFALESSGVEQFEPDIEACYKGLEKHIEVIREKERTDVLSLTGRIAEVVRPGYQYAVSDDDVKIVRCAQVKLYG